jgi:hypothetical protein
MFTVICHAAEYGIDIIRNGATWRHS